LIVTLMAVVSTFMPGYLADAGVRRAVAAGLSARRLSRAAIVGLIVAAPPDGARRCAGRLCAGPFVQLARAVVARSALPVRQQRSGRDDDAGAAHARKGRAFWIIGYEQPSIIFLTRTWVRFVEIEDVTETPINAGDGMMIEGRVFDQTFKLRCASAWTGGSSLWINRRAAWRSAAAST
jgi:hypothetical protein